MSEDTWEVSGGADQYGIEDVTFVRRDPQRRGRRAFEHVARFELRATAPGGGVRKEWYSTEAERGLRWADLVAWSTARQRAAA